MANIYHRRRALTEILRRELSDNYLVVPNPDHPLLLRGPDILIAGHKATVAIFMPLVEERRLEGSFRSRLVLSRLALPPYVRCVMISEPNDHHLAQSFSNDFAYVVDWSSRADLLSIASSDDIPSRHRDVPPEIISAAQTRFSNAMTVMRLGARLTAKPFSAAFNEKSPGLRQAARSAIRHPKRRPIIEKFEDVAFVELSDSDVDTSLVREIVDQQTADSFSLDGGIPYAKSDPTGLAVVRDWPIRTRDTEKLILAAAFGGWAFVLEELRSELPRFAKRLNLRRDA